jgi:transcriptional regulator GlxA family with amidase domain
MTPRRVGIIGYEGVQALDLVGPFDAFTTVKAEDKTGKIQPGYEVVIIGLNGKVFRSEGGLLFRPHVPLRNAPAIDTLLIPGGEGSRIAKTSETIAQWVATRAQQIRRIASVCTGIYALAPTGLLNGRQVTTHWRFAADVMNRFPKLKVDHNALFLKDGRYYTAGGITASIDLALALIEEDYGARVALAVARELVVYLKRPGGQKQYSEPLEFQISAADRFSELATWILGHLRDNLSLEALASRVCLSPRHFARRFKQSFGTTPAALVNSIRLEEARRRLTEGTQNIKRIAASVGFHSENAFRYAFERRFGVKPSSYRSVFNARVKLSGNGIETNDS